MYRFNVIYATSKAVYVNLQKFVSFDACGIILKKIKLSLVKKENDDRICDRIEAEME